MIVKKIDWAYAQSKMFENEDVKKKRDPLTFVELKMLLISAIIILGSLIFYTWFSLEYIRNQYELRNLETQLINLKKENQKLALEKEYLSSTEKIQEIASSILGLAPTEAERIFILNEKNLPTQEKIFIAKKEDKDLITKKVQEDEGSTAQVLYNRKDD